MSELYELKNIDISRNGVKVHVDMSRINRNLNRAQYALDSRIMTDMVPLMPMQTGNFIHRTVAESAAMAGTGKVMAAAPPFGRFLYNGKVMVDATTGKGPMKISTGPGGGYVLRFREGAKLRPTERNLVYSRPEAKSKWFEEAKKRHKDEWIELVRKEVAKP